MPFQKGNKIWLGKKHTEKSKEKMSLFQIGQKRSKKTKEKIRKACRGRKVSDETRKKLSVICKKMGTRPPSPLGRHLSKETKQKIGNSNRGHKQSKELRKKLNELASKRCGSKHYNWKGGINPINDTIRKSSEIKLWKKACLERDNFICQKYGTKGGILRVHHINNFADFPELRTTISNGITLSEKAHKEFHKIYGVRNNTREQLNDFLSKE